MGKFLDKTARLVSLTSVVILMSLAAANLALGRDRSAVINFMGAVGVYMVSKL